jgi:hypothetical protein
MDEQIEVFVVRFTLRKEAGMNEFFTKFGIVCFYSLLIGALIGFASAIPRR